jgi:hypothetical protein
MFWFLGKKEKKVSQVDEEELELEKEEEIIEQPKGHLWFIVFLFLLIFFLALIPRLYFLFFVSDPQNAGAGWYGDVYHHWQIGYLTKEIGIGQGFRLWDLKGMEYYWGVLHPLLLALIYTFTLPDIVVVRLVSTIAGSFVVLFLFLLARRFWNFQVGLAVAAIAALNPISIFNDTTGMLEPIGIGLLLFGIWLWPKIEFLTGFIWALAAAARAEAWLFSIGLITSALVRVRVAGKGVLLVVGWIVPMLVYMKYLLDHTGNLIYPVWWNFLANVVGKWEFREELTQLQLFVKPIFIGLMIFSLLAILVILWKKPRGSLLLLLGFGNWLLLGIFFGVAAYIKSFEIWFWMIRFFVFPYVFAALLVIIFLFYLLPKITRLGFVKIYLAIFGWILVILGLFFWQLAWQPILVEYKKTQTTWQNKIAWADQISKKYQGGKILIDEGEPDLTYTLVKFEGITGKNIVGQMYDPFFYIGEDEAFTNWGKYRKDVLNWLKKEEIRLIMVRSDRERYKKLFEKEKELFQFEEEIPQSPYVLYKVGQV